MISMERGSDRPHRVGFKVRRHKTVLLALGAMGLAAIFFLGRNGVASRVQRSVEPPDPALATRLLFEEGEAGQMHTPLIGEEVKIRSGDTLLHLLNRRGVEGDEAHQLVAVMRPYLDPKDLRAGQSIKLIVNAESRELSGLELFQRNHVLRLRATVEGWKAEQRTLPTVKETRVLRGDVTGSLYESGLEVGLTPMQIMELATLFEYDIDFFSDFQRGDQFSVLFDETRYENGRRASREILAAELKVGNEPFQIFRFTSRQGKAEYFDGEGKTRRRAFLRAPLSFTRISSRYNPNRRHPIFRTVRPHRAIDYAAPTGTPVVALGNGRVTHAGWRGGYGKMVEIQHPNGYATRYAHFSRIASKIRRGRQVGQGQVIGYVGQTGHATGPHLHFEMLRKGRKINFLALRIPTTEQLRGAELRRFLEQRDSRLVLLQANPTLVASTNGCAPPAQQAC